MATASEFSRSSAVNRTILVTGIPYITDDCDELKDKLNVHFGKSKNGGGDVETIICPFGGSLAKALVVFESETVVDTVCDHKHDLGGEPMEAHRLPPVFAEVIGSIDDFYWNALPRDKSKKLIPHLLQIFGHEKAKRTKHRLTEVTGTIDQLKEVEERIGSTLGLLPGNGDSKCDMTQIVQKTVAIKDILYMTDNEDQIRDEITVYVKQVAKADLEILLCPIQGSLQKAIVVFKSIEDRNRFVEHGNHVFFKELLHVEELPPVFKEVVATVDGFYLKHMPKTKMTRLTSLMQDKLGINVSQDGQEFNGNLKHIRQALFHFMDTFGLPERGDQTMENSETHDGSEHSGKAQTSQNKKNLESDSKYQSRQPKSSLAGKAHDIMETESSKPSYLGRMQSVEDTDKQTPYKTERSNDNRYDITPDDRGLDMQHQFSDTKTKGNRVITTTMRSTGDDPRCSDAKRHCKDVDAQEANSIKLVEDHFSHPKGAANYSSNVQQMGATEKAITERYEDESTTKLSAEGDLLNNGSNSAQGTMVTSQSRFSECHISVDRTKFHYIKAHHKNALTSLEKKHNVNIKLCTSDNSLVKLKSRGSLSKGKERTNIPKAQEEFLQLYNDISRNAKKEIVPFTNNDDDQLKKIQENMKKKFPKVLMMWNKDTECTLCGDKAEVESATQELNELVSCYEGLSVDRIAFEYLSTVNKDELHCIQKKYKIVLEVQEADTNDTNQNTVYIRPQKSSKSKCSLKNLQKAKEEFISLYQTIFYRIKRISIKCPGVSEKVIAEAEEGTRKVHSGFHILKGITSDEIIVCAEEQNADDALREFRNRAGLLPRRRLRKLASNEEQTNQISQHASTTPMTTKSTEGKAKSSPTGNSPLSPTFFVTEEGLQIILITGDITQQNVDVIVNAANPRLIHDGGVAKAISVAAGPELQQECKDILRHSKLPVGECIHTNSFNLQCQRVIHAVGPRYQGDIASFSSLLAKTFTNVLTLSDVVICARSIAIPLISSGAFHGPKQNCAEILVTVLKDFSRNQKERSLHQVYLVNIDEETTHVLQQACVNILPPPVQSIKRPSGNGKPISTSRAEYKTSKGLEIIVETGDITDIRVGVIVNAANKHLRHGRGVAAAISKAAGKQLQEECEHIMKNRRPLQTGEYEVTDGYKLHCKVLHTVGPIYSEYTSDDEFYRTLRKTFLSALRYVNIPIEAKDIAIPLVSSGIYGGPKRICAKALLEAIEEFNREPNLVIKTIHLVNLDDESTQALQEVFSERYSERPVVSSMPTTLQSDDGLKHKTVHGISLCVIEGDITKQDVDAIVNPTDEYLKHQGGVASAIASAAGRELSECCQNIMKKRKRTPIQVGDVIISDGFKLRCRHILHTPSPLFAGNRSERRDQKYHDTLVKTFETCLHVANCQTGVKSIAIPLIGAGISGAPKKLCADAMVKAIKSFDVKEDQLSLQAIVFASTEKKAILAVKKALKEHFCPQTSSKKKEHTNILLTENLSVETFQTSEGILVVNQHGDITNQKADVMINCTDERLKNDAGLPLRISQAAGPEFQKECDMLIKKRKGPLKEGDIITTEGYKLCITNVMHTVEPKYDNIEMQLLKMFLHAGTSLGAQSITLSLIGHTTGDIGFCAGATARSVRRFSRSTRSVKKITFVNADAPTYAELGKVLSSTFQAIGGEPGSLGADSCPPPTQSTRNHQSNVQSQGAVPKHSRQTSALNQQLGNTQDGSQAQNDGYIKSWVMPVVNWFTSSEASEDIGDQSDVERCSSSDDTYSSDVRDLSGNTPPASLRDGNNSRRSKCERCGLKNDIMKRLEGCGHTFCKNCFIQYVEQNEVCSTCHSLYCVVHEETMRGTMTYFIRTNLSLSGESGNGAIVIQYEFPDSTVETQNPYSIGRRYDGKTFTAYLPNTDEGVKVVYLLRKAFVKGRTFVVKPKTSGTELEIAWSDLIPHKVNFKRSTGNDGYPDPTYLSRLRKALADQGIESDLTSYV